MGWRFRRRLRIAPGVHMNLNKRGGSFSVGRPGATMNLGQRRLTLGIPGSGISYSRRLGGRSRGGPRGQHAMLGVLVVGAALLLLYWLAG